MAPNGRQRAAEARRVRLGPVYENLAIKGWPGTAIAKELHVTHRQALGDMVALGITGWRQRDGPRMRARWTQISHSRAMIRLAAGEKTCVGCAQALPLECFSPCRSHLDGRQSRCRACHADGERARRAAAQEHAAVQTRAAKTDVWAQLAALSRPPAPRHGPGKRYKIVAKCYGAPLVNGPDWWQPLAHSATCRDRWQPQADPVE
jgi:hypothetical protein